MMLRTRSLFTVFALTVALASVPALAAKTHDPSTPEGALEMGRDHGFSGVKGTFGKKSSQAPKKIAVADFQVRYTFVTTQTRDGDFLKSMKLKFTDEHYQALTDALLARFVETMQAAGYEVVDPARVVETATYQTTEGDSDPKENFRREVYAPTGMKRIGWIKHGRLAGGLNHELGADASVAVAVNFALCQGRRGKDDVKVCIAVQQGANPPGMLFHAGAVPVEKKGETLYGLQWSGGFNKGAKKVSESGEDLSALVYDDEVMETRRYGLFAQELEADASAFADGTLTLLDVWLELGLAQWHAIVTKYAD